ncbi:MAG: MraY family glycosyltransferase, partial [Gammaproteobacteria bacterium]
GGGLAIVLCFFMGIFFLHPPAPFAWALLTGGGLITLVGYLDDRYSLSAKIRFAVQILAALMSLYCLNLPLWTLLPIVWLINLYNFMDGIDTLASIQGIFVSVAAGTALFYLGVFNLATICFLLTAVLLGFLYWNFPPARIFMGDAGSGTLGFIFALLIFSTPLPLPFWFIIMAVFICDTTLTLLRRMLQGEKWYSAHCSHAYQRLVQRGYTHKQVSFGILIFNLCILLPLAWLSFIYPVCATALALLICTYLWYRIIFT